MRHDNLKIWQKATDPNRTGIPLFGAGVGVTLDGVFWDQSEATRLSVGEPMVGESRCEG